MAAPNLDLIDKKIISVLAEDGRRPYREIARVLNVSEGMIRQRVGRLTETGLIHITAVGNMFNLGFDVIAMIHLNVRPDKIDEYAAAIAEYAYVRFVAISVGKADIILQSLHNSMHDLHAFTRNELLQKHPEITAMEIFPLVQRIKSTWSWDAWFDLQEQQYDANATQQQGTK
mgnify:CR=1 FL=1